MTDAFRGWLIDRRRAAPHRALSDAYTDALIEYDRHASEHERAAKALRLIEDCAAHWKGVGGCETCPVADDCSRHGCELGMLKRAGERLGILPAVKDFLTTEL